MEKVNVGILVDSHKECTHISEVLAKSDKYDVFILSKKDELPICPKLHINILVIDDKNEKHLAFIKATLNIEEIVKIVDNNTVTYDDDNSYLIYQHIFRPIEPKMFTIAIDIMNKVRESKKNYLKGKVDNTYADFNFSEMAVWLVALDWLYSEKKCFYKTGNIKQFCRGLIEQLMCLTRARCAALELCKNIQDGECFYAGASILTTEIIEKFQLKKKLIDTEIKSDFDPLGKIYLAEKESGQSFSLFDEKLLKLFADELVLILKSNELVQSLREQNYALAGTQTRLKHLFKSSPAMTYSAHPGPNYAITFVSENIERQLGYSPQEVIQEKNFWLNHIHPDDRTMVIAGISAAIRNKKQVSEFRFQTKSEVYKWIRDEIRAVHDRDGNLLELVGSCLDITEQKSTEEELKKSHNELRDAYARLQETQNQLLQSEKMASIGQLAAGVAHEINNPIGYLSSNLGSLRKYIVDIFQLLNFYMSLEKKLDSDVVNEIEAIKKEVDIDFLMEDLQNLLRESDEGIKRVKDIVRDLKDFAHVENHEWQIADIHKGLESTLNIVHNEIKYKAQIIKKFGKIPEVECLPSQLNQVFMNLFVNAAHAIEDRGTITIRTGIDDEYFVTIEIEDTGKGVSAENLPKIFDPFFTTKPVGKGTGLGLYISYGIIKKHGGVIDVVSVVGEGTKFIIRLPVMQPLERTDSQKKN